MSVQFGNYIPFNPAGVPSQLLANYCQACANMMALGPRLLGMLNAAIGAEGASQFTAIEAMFNLPAGSGQTIFNAVNGSQGAATGMMQNNQIVNCGTQMG